MIFQLLSVCFSVIVLIALPVFHQFNHVVCTLKACQLPSLAYDLLCALSLTIWTLFASLFITRKTHLASVNSLPSSGVHCMMLSIYNPRLPPYPISRHFFISKAELWFNQSNSLWCHLSKLTLAVLFCSVLYPSEGRPHLWMIFL